MVFVYLHLPKKINQMYRAVQNPLESEAFWPMLPRDSLVIHLPWWMMIQEMAFSGLKICCESLNINNTKKVH